MVTSNKLCHQDLSKIDQSGHTTLSPPDTPLLSLSLSLSLSHLRSVFHCGRLRRWTSRKRRQRQNELFTHLRFQEQLKTSSVYLVLGSSAWTYLQCDQIGPVFTALGNFYRTLAILKGVLSIGH